MYSLRRKVAVWLLSGVTLFEFGVWAGHQEKRRLEYIEAHSTNTTTTVSLPYILCAVCPTSEDR